MLRKCYQKFVGLIIKIPYLRTSKLSKDWLDDSKISLVSKLGVAYLFDEFTRDIWLFCYLLLLAAMSGQGIRENGTFCYGI